MATALQRQAKIVAKINSKGSQMTRKARSYRKNGVTHTDAEETFLVIPFPDSERKVYGFEEMGMANAQDADPNTVLCKHDAPVREGDVVYKTLFPENEYTISEKEPFIISDVLIMVKLRIVRVRHTADV